MKQPICLTCWMEEHPQQFATLNPNREHRVHSCHKCGFLTSAGLTHDAEQRARDDSAWKIFKLAFLLWVVPALILYLKARTR